MMGEPALEKGFGEDIKRYGQTLINERQEAGEKVKTNRQGTEHPIDGNADAQAVRSRKVGSDG